MVVMTLTLGLAFLAGTAPPGVPPSAADAVVLSDGKVALGQVLEPSPRGTLRFQIRRDWARENLPDWFARWESAEAPGLRRAVAQRRERLAAWRRERAKAAGPDDRILDWLGREIARLDDPAGPSPAKLMVVSLNRAGLKSIVKRPATVAEMLRLGWLSGIPDAESRPVDSLADALEGRGFDPKGGTPSNLDRLRPLALETDAQWLARRAATEVLNDPGTRFVRTGSLLLPEPEPGQPLPIGSALGALGDLKRLLEDNPTDPLADRLRTVADRGGVGAVVTRLDLGDGSNIRVESVLMVRPGADRWVVCGSRAAVVNTQNLEKDAGGDLADDPQVKAAFRLVESIGLGPIPDEFKRQSLNAGAASQRALAEVRAVSQRDLTDLALPIDEAPPPAKDPEAKPEGPGTAEGREGKSN